jgi:cell division protease FtsH
MMVTRWGFSKELGAVSYGENQDEVFLGMSVSRQQNISEETARKIDSEVKRLVDGGFAEARRILTEKRDDLEKLARALLEYETLSGDEILKVLRGEKLDRPDVPPPSQLPPTPALPVIDDAETHDPRRRWGQGPDPAPAGA